MTVFVPDTVELANTTTDGDQFQPSVAALPGGGWVVVWTSGTGASSAVYSQVFDADGNKVGGETLLYQEFSAFGVKAGGVAGLADGSFVVSFWTGRQERSFTYDNVWGIRVDADGQVRGDPFVVDVSQSVASGGSQTTSAGEVCAAPDGGFYVAMVRMYPPSPVSTWSTDLQRYDADGNPVGTLFPAAQGFPNASISVLPDGRIATASDVWGGPVGTSVEWNVLAPDGQPIAQGVLHESAFARDFNPSVTALADGRWVLVWSHEPDTVLMPPSPTPAGVYAAFLDAGGQVVAAPGLLDVPQAPDILALPNGGFLAYWAQSTGGGHDAWFAREFSALAQPLGEAFAIAAPAPGQAGALFKPLPDVAVLPDGGFVVAFDAAGKGEDVFVQEFNPAPAEGKTIEGGAGKDDLQGTTAADILRGANGRDTLFGNLGNDILDGGKGVDTALFTGNRDQYVLSLGAAGYVMNGPDGTDTLIDVEWLQFADTKVALDVALVGTTQHGMSQPA